MLLTFAIDFWRDVMQLIHLPVRRIDHYTEERTTCSFTAAAHFIICGLCLRSPNATHKKLIGYKQKALPLFHDVRTYSALA